MRFGLTDAFERQYDASGKETAVVQTERTKIRTGYLNSSYQVVYSQHGTVSHFIHSLYFLFLIFIFVCRSALYRESVQMEV